MRSFLISLMLALVVTGPAVAQEKLEAILRDKPFLTVTRGRFQFYYYEGSEAERKQDQMIAQREEALARLEEFFGRRVTDPVHLLVYPNYEEARPYPCGRTSPEERLVHIALQPGYWAYERHNPGHELAHLLAMTDPEGNKIWVVPLLNEGIAEYFCGAEVDPHLRLTEYLHCERKVRPVCIDSRHLYGGAGLYPMAGSFAKFLIEHYPQGREKFLTLLSRTRMSDWDDVPYFPEFMKTLEEVYETDYVTMMDDWNRELEPYWKARYELRPQDRLQLETVLKEAGKSPMASARYYEFGRFLRLVLKLEDGEVVLVEATPDDGWRVVKGSRDRR